MNDSTILSISLYAVITDSQLILHLPTQFSPVTLPNPICMLLCVPFTLPVIDPLGNQYIIDVYIAPLCSLRITTAIIHNN